MNLAFCELYSHALGTLQLKRVLAKSGSGSVYLASTATRQYAIKHVPKKHTHLQEIRLHQEISHLPCVVPLIEASMAIAPDSGYLLTMPYFSDGSLFEWLTQNDNITFATRKHVCMQAFYALSTLHRIGVYHRDIKLENFLVHVQGNGRIDVRLTDFGMATKNRWSRDRGCGSLMYMSPETIYSLKLPHGHQLPILDAAKQDTWSMTQMVLNLMLSVNAWRAADASQDEFYQLYLLNPNKHLLLLLPLTDAFHAIVRAGFELDWTQRSTVDELYDMMADCWSFECPRGVFEERRSMALMHLAHAKQAQEEDEEEEEEEEVEGWQMRVVAQDQHSSLDSLGMEEEEMVKTPLDGDYEREKESMSTFFEERIGPPACPSSIKVQPRSASVMYGERLLCRLPELSL